MGRSFKDECKDCYGELEASVICDICPQWIFRDFIEQHQNGVVGLGVADESRDYPYVTLWHNHGIFDQDYLQTILCCTRCHYPNARSQVVEHIYEESIEEPYPELAIQYFTAAELNMHVGIGTLRLKDKVFIVFAAERDNKLLAQILKGIFECIYAICYTLAPKNYSADAVVDFFNAYRYRFLAPGLAVADQQDAINHVKEAFENNVFDSIEKWNKN